MKPKSNTRRIEEFLDLFCEVEKQLKKLGSKSIWCIETLEWEAKPDGDAKRDSMHAGVLDGETMLLYSVKIDGRFFEEKQE